MMTAVRAKWIALAFGVALVSSPLVADQKCWTAVASTGRVDEKDIKTMATESDGPVKILPTVNHASANIRFNVVAVDGTEGSIVAGPGTDNITFTMRYRDNGSDAEVKAVLRQVGVVSGSTTVLGTALSLDGSDNYQVTSYCFPGSFDFDNYAYTIEIVLSKAAPGGDPRIKSMQVCAGDAGCSVSTD